MSSNRPRRSLRAIRIDPGFADSLASAGLASLRALSDPALGEPVTDSRSSWVRRVMVDSRHYYVKTYIYPRWRDKVRGAFRNTYLAASRARREHDALQWLQSGGFAGPKPVALLEQRFLGWLRCAVLITEAWPGESLDSVLGGLAPAEANRALAHLEDMVEQLHRAGFRSRNLDLRNVLAQRTDEGWQLALIDSPRYRLVTPGPAHDKLARQDWQRLDESIGAVQGLKNR